MVKPREVGVGRRCRAARARNPRRISRDGVVVGRRVARDLAVSNRGCLMVVGVVTIGLAGTWLLAHDLTKAAVACFVAAPVLAVGMNRMK